MTFPGETTEPSPKEDVLSAFQNRRGDETRDILSQHAMGLAKQTSGGSALGLDTAVVAGTALWLEAPPPRLVNMHSVGRLSRCPKSEARSLSDFWVAVMSQPPYYMRHAFPGTAC